MTKVGQNSSELRASRGLILFVIKEQGFNHSVLVLVVSVSLRIDLKMDL